ncbi:hypothetical protein M378DRAFT_78711 [Amanita muscaria Koide BX008]|uniref:Kinase n=1 Tax=Amanita muscaria (strain Koide BX008) TaxID=946122 RepID=A0A0C2WR21_AMAMK|nr:hypothetical protein M378DRAFT_78711 [Amanita muscaria Koide BX008]
MQGPLTSQVGGHQGVTTSDDDSLIIKPALPTEIAFYQALNSDPVLAPLRPFVPQFVGTLRLEGELIKLDGDIEQNNIRPPPANEKSDELRCYISAVLENLTHRFIKPNVLDAKLGTVLYDEDAPLEKKQRMMETARKTTSFETGVRLTGFQVYDNVTNQPILTPKSYGKSIDKSQLPDGIARFLPVGGSKEEEASPCGLPVSLLLPIMQGIKEDIQEIRDVVASLEVRIVGGSLLVIYEADWERAEKGLKWLEEQDDEDEMDDDDEESEDEERGGPPYVVKLIDFAHTRLVPGKGPDEGVLTGIDTMIRLIDGRIKELTP